jgi:hypothetical protein
MEHAVIINVPLSDADLGTPGDDAVIESIDAEIRSFLSTSTAGEWDGHEFGGGWARIFCYGDNADVLFDALLDVLLAMTLPARTFAVKRYGSPGAREDLIELSGGAA